MQAGFADERRKLYDRRPSAAGLIVDEEGVSLGPRYSLVERHRGGCRVIGQRAAGVLLRTVFDYEDDPAPFVGLCRLMAKALDDGNLLRAQLLGLQMPMGRLQPEHLERLDRLTALEKAGYRPDQPRNADGEWGFGAAAAAATASIATFEESLAAGAGEVAATVGTAASALVAPILLAGGLLIPSSKSNVHEGDVIGHPDMVYRYDEGVLTLTHVDPSGGRTTLFHGYTADGDYRDDDGNLIGRRLPSGLDLAPEFLSAMSALSNKTKAKADATATTDDSNPQVCPDPSRASEFMSAESAAYQMQITGLPKGFVVRLNGVKYDGCDPRNGHMQEAKAGLLQFMDADGEWQRWFTGFEAIQEQMVRQSKNSGGRQVDWYFAESPVADKFRKFAEVKKLSNITVYYVPADR